MPDDMRPSWPDRLWIVRHGESTGNVARDLATDAGLDVIDIPERDIDVPLSDTGREQSAALGRWFAEMPAGTRPTLMLVSPYARARQTAEAIARAGGIEARAVVRVDERLREKEFGALDRLTRRGIEQRYPHEAEARARKGKFYYRPPGGESWCDVILRLRSVLSTIHDERAAAPCRVLIVAHQVIVLCLRYAIEGLTEEEILAIDGEGDVKNCGVTAYHCGPNDARPTLDVYNFVAPQLDAAAPVTAEPPHQPPGDR